MKILRILIYLFITLLVIFVPIYGSAARILLPNWLKNYISSSLPEGSELQIGEMEQPQNGCVYIKTLFLKIIIKLSHTVCRILYWNLI